MTKEKQALSDEHQKQMDQTKGVSTHVPTDNKFEIYQQISYMDNVKGVNHACFSLVISSIIDIHWKRNTCKIKFSKYSGDFFPQY
jgi:hypothetical protein